MKSKVHTRLRVYLLVALAGLLVLVLWPSLATATPPTSQDDLKEAWRLAGEASRFAFQTDVLQTTHPTVRLDNAGRHPRRERFSAQGVIDRSQKALEIKLWSPGSSRDGIELKVQDGRAYGRLDAGGDWTEIPNSTDLFAPGGDPLGFLMAAENVQEATAHEPGMLDDVLANPQSLLPGLTRYTFGVNSVRYAEMMRQHLQANMERNGELAFGMTVGPIAQYVGMRAHGEIWVGPEGHPVRQIVHLEFPPERGAREWLEADVSTEFSGWVQADANGSGLSSLRTTWTTLVSWALAPETGRQLGLSLGFGLLALGLLALIITHRRSRKLYLAIALSVMLVMLVTPLTRSHQVAALSQRRQARLAQFSQQEAAGQALQASAPTFNPLVNPLTGQLGANAPRTTQYAIRNAQYAPSLLQDSCDYTVSDDDCDGDGLTNGVELYELGTDPEAIDTDGDDVSDKLEVEGFSYAGQQWYLDPLNPDSNGDGIMDGLECVERMDVDLVTGELRADFTPGVCANNDTDTTPDVFDFDNDGDGVPDSVDGSPYAVEGSFTSTSPLGFNLVFTGTEKPVFVDFELRPTNPDHLWYTQNVLDWPDDDTEGQIMRVHDSTYADLSAYSDMEDGADGDLFLSPLLELEITYDAANPSAGLPITTGMSSADITDYSDISWLDSDALDELGISYNSGDEDTLYLWIPLYHVKDDVGDTPVAWSARMLYRPESGLTALGNDQQVRVVWMLEGLSDSCDTSGMTDDDDYDTYCADESNWTTDSSVLQTYYDDFDLTGLTVREDHGLDVALIAEPEGTGNAYYDDYLWHLADSLQVAFLEAMTNTVTSERFAVSDIATYKDTWGMSALVVNEFSFDSELGLADIAATHSTDVLNSVFGSAAVDDTATLLFAGEDTARVTAMGDGNSEMNGDTLTVDVTAASLDTTAQLRWAPYVYEGAGVWDSGDLETYMAALDTTLENVFTDAQLDVLAGDEAVDDYDQARAGAIGLAQSFYLSLYIGLAQVVEEDGNAYSAEVLSDFSLGSDEPVAVIVQTLLAAIQDYYADLALVDALIYANNAASYAASSLSATLASSLSAILGAVGTLVSGEASTTLSLAMQELDNYYKTADVDTTAFTTVGSIAALAGASYVSQSRAMSLDLFSTDLSIPFTIARMAQHIYYIKWGWNVYKTFSTYAALANSAGLQGRTALSVTYITDGAKIVRSCRIWAVAVLIITVAVVWGLFAYGSYDNNLERDAAIAQAIASTIVAMIMAAIAAIPIAGWLIVGVIGLIDALIMFVCAVIGVEEGSDVDRWVCGGITGALTQAIVYMIFDQYIVADLEDDDRLEIALNDPTLAQKVDNAGFVTGNELSLNAVITNTISKASLTGIGSAMDDFFGIHDQDELLKKSTFTYTLQASEVDQHAGLSLGQLDWVDNQEVFTVAAPTTFSSAGINQATSLYLTESFYVPALECWGFLIQVCGREDYKDSYHTYLGDSFVFDVFPNTFDGFYSLSGSATGGYRLSWDAQFPKLADADGDDLLSQAVGGPDPDDGTWDTDNDGLSDYWELDNGFDPEARDGDGDGLDDYWEAFYNTDPFLADSDGDGLTDGDEMFHSNSVHAYESDDSTWSGGWTIVYDYDSSGLALQTHVSADPLDYDSDDDTILDNYEFIYGYNPNLTSVLNVLSLNTEVTNNVVAPGNSLAYTATVKNELNNRVANGLLQAEFPVDTVQSTTIIGSLYPLMSATLSDTVTAPGVSATESTSLTLRAGAVIDTSAVNQIFVLNLDEDAGATTFYDATSNHHDFTKYGNPVANSGYVTFDGNDGLQYDSDSSFDYDAFSFETWLRPTTTPQGGTTLFRHTLGQFEVRLTSNYWVQVYISGALYLTGSEALTQDEWNHVMVTYDASSGALAAYVNGQLDAEISSAPAVTWYEPYDFFIGFRFQGDMDYAALHDYALSEAEAAELFSNSLTFYATFDQDCGSYYDAISYQDINCTLDDSGGINLIDAPFSDYGILGTSLSLVSVNPFGVYNGFGDNAFVEVDGDVPLAGTDGAFTIGLWLKKSGDGGSIPWYYLLTLEGDGGNYFETFLNSSSNLKYRMGNCGGTWNLSESEYLPDWRWHHLGFTYDGVDTLRVYADGEQVASKTCSGTPDLRTLNLVHIGAPNTSDTDRRAFRGQVDEMRFYRKAFSDEQMDVLYKESGRMLHLAFDEPPGQTTFEDNSPNGYDGSCVGTDCPDSGLAGRNNQAIDMLENKIALETADQLGLTENNFTVMAWVKAEAFGGATRTVLGTETAQDLQGLILGVKAAKPYMSFWGTDNDLTGSTTLNAGEWIHLAWRYEYQVNNSLVEEMTLFVNGVEEATASNRSAFVGTDTVYVGKSYGDSYFHGMIDDLVIVKQALTADEIQEIMGEAPLVNLHLDEDLNTTTFTDDSPGQYDATCSGDTCPAAGAKGQMREAPVFSGSDELTLSTVSGLYAQPFSLGLWAKPTKIKTDAQYLINNDDNIGLTLGAGGTGLDLVCNWVTYADNGELIEDQWNHVFVTGEYDSSTMSATYTFYVNGSETGSVSPSGTCAPLSGAVLGENFEGNLDEVTIYDTILNSEEVRAIYDYQAAWYDVVEQHLITIDADDPIVTFTTPDYLANESVWLTIGAIDAGSEIDTVQVTVTPPSGGSTTEAAVRSESGEGNNGAWLYEFIPSGVGAYTLEVVATDAVGNAATVSQSFSVDGDPPSATLDATLTGTAIGTTTPVTGSETVALYGTVSDSGAASGGPVSGVATNTVAVSLYDWQGIPVEGARYATSDGSTWAVDYPFNTAPYGLYDVWLSLEDEAGNAYTGTLGTVGVDGYGPGADVALTGAAITSTGTVVTGVASDVPYPQESRVVHLHFEESAGATEFADSTGNFLHATCSGDACPTAGESGKRGSAVRFDGGDDTLRIDTDLDPAAETFSALARFKVDALGDQQVILQQDNGTGQGRTWLYLNGAGQLVSNLGETPSTTPSAATAGAWHHAALTYDGSEVRLYLDGVLEISEARTAEAADGPLDIGSNRGGSAFFDGLVDEFVVYSRVLGEEEIYDIANPLPTGMASAQIRYRHLQDGAQDESAGTWYDVTLDAAGDTFTTWQHVVPGTLDEGPYKIDLKATDDVGNESYIPNVWSGEIDLHAPVLTYTYTPITGNYVRVSCEASDFSITTDDWVCPASDLYKAAETDTWFTDFFGTVTRTTTLTTPVQILASPGNTLTACDIYGHCATETLVAAPTITEVSAILTPTTGASFYGYDPIEIGGLVRSPDDVRALTVTVDGQAIYTTTWAAGTTEENWSTTWTPTTYGDYSLEAVLTNGLGKTIIDEAETVITVRYPDLSIAKTVTPTVDLQAGDAVTYTLTITNSGNADAPGAVVSDTLPAGVVGSDLIQTVDVLAGEVLTYTVTGTVIGTEPLVVNTGSVSHTSGDAQDSVTLPRCDYLAVTNANDSGAGSLRQAVADACEGALITFEGDYDIYLDSTLDVAQTLTVDATGHTVTVSGDSGNDGSRNVRVFSIAPSNAVTLTHLSVISGFAASGGGIYNAGTLTLLDLTITDNEADHISAPKGGGIINNGTLTIEGSTLTDNVLSRGSIHRGGAIYNSTGSTLIISTSVISGHQSTEGGGIFNYGTLLSTQNVFVNNTASGSGGGIYNYYGNATLDNNTFAENSANTNGGGVYNDVYSTLTVNNSTFSDNTAGNAGGGIANRMLASIHISNTIVANSNATVDCYASVDSTAVSVVNSLFETYDGCGTPVTTADPLLADLGDYGGDTLTFALLPGSPALDVGDDATCKSADQRGVARVGACDIGAFESQGFGLSVAGGDGQSTAINTAFGTPLALTVTANAPAEPVAGGVAAWAGPATGAGIMASVTATVGSDGVASATVTANNVAGSYTVTGTVVGSDDNALYTLTNLCSSDTYTVTSAADDGAGTLRRGIFNTCSGGSITFAGDMTILLDSPLEIDKDLGIDSGGNAITLSGQSTHRILAIGAAIDVSLSGVDLVDGVGAILNAGALTLTDSALSGHTTAIQNAGDLSISNAEFSANSTHISNTLDLTLTNSALAGSTGDGVENAGTLTLSHVTLSDSGGNGLFSTGAVTLSQVTISGSAGDALVSSGDLALSNVTLAHSLGNGLDNTGTATLNNVAIAGSGGSGLVNAGTLHLRNSLVAGSTLSDCVDSGVIATNAHTLIEDGACSPALSGDPLLASLDDYGGEEQTFALLPGSPAIDAGDAATCESADQRGVGRVGECDLGAFESQGFTLSYISGSGQRVSLNSAFPAPLQVQVTANAITEPVGAGGVVAYTGPSSGAGLSLSEASAATDASGAAGLDGTANDVPGTYVVSATMPGASEVVTFSLENYSCTTFVVSNANDSGLGSLRQAVTEACDGASITFADDFTITLQSELSLDQRLTIDGSGHDIVISGDSDGDGVRDQYTDVRPFTIQSGAAVTLTHMTIISGTDRAADGGAIYNAGSLYLYNMLFQGNYAYGSNTIVQGGGAIFNTGNLTAVNCAFLDNASYSDGGALSGSGQTTLINCTFSGNYAGYVAGAIQQRGGALRVYNSTLAENSVGGVGYPGLYSVLGASLDIRNTLIYSNTGGNWQCYNNGALVSTHNLIPEGNLGCGDSLSGSPRLGPLGAYGSPVDGLAPALPTYPLLMDSSAINAGDDAVCESTDQRGAARVNTCDIGAFEAQFALTPTGGDGQSTPAGAAFAEALAVAVSSMYDAPVGAAGVITFTGAGLVADYPATVDASGAASATVTANLLVGSYVVTATGSGVITPATFMLTNTNAAPVVSNATFTVQEIASVGTAVGSVVASDANGHSLHYSLTAGNVGDAFAIDSTGQITVAAALEYDVTPQYLLTVGVSDGYITSTATITINVTACGAQVVTSDADSGAGSLRQIVADACPGDTITFADAYTILLDSAVALAQPLTIDGSGQNVTLSGQDTTRIFSIGSSGVVTLNQLSLVHGYHDEGGGAIVGQTGSTLTVLDSFFSDNASDWAGGAIVSEGTLIVSDTTFSNNSALDWGGAIYSMDVLTVTGSIFNANTCPIGGALELDNGGWVANSTFMSNTAEYGGAVDVYGGELHITNSTFTGNRIDDGEGGAIYNGGTLWITNSTFYSNTATGQKHTGDGVYYRGFGGAIYNSDVATINNSTFVSNTAAFTGTTLYNDGGTVSLQNSLIAGAATFMHCYGGLGANANNLIEDGSCSPALNGDPRVGTLGNYGGETQTIPLLPDSPAIDAGDAATCAADDQRGYARDDWACDLGAFEMHLSDGDTVSKTVTTGGTYTFGPTLVRVQVDDDGGCLAGLAVQRVESDHPSATAGIQTGRYWTLTPAGCSSGFTATLTLPFDVTPSANDKACRWDVGLAQWDCGVDGNNGTSSGGPEAMPDIVIRQEVGEFSDWAVGSNVGPTAVTLQSFSATPREGGVELAWETATEIGLVGFYVSRSESPAGERIRLNDVIIPSQSPGGPMGARYHLLDEAVVPGASYYYWLEAVDADGSTILYGPVSAVAAEHPSSPFRIFVPVVRENSQP